MSPIVLEETPRERRPTLEVPCFLADGGSCPGGNCDSSGFRGAMGYTIFRQTYLYIIIRI